MYAKKQQNKKSKIEDNNIKTGEGNNLMLNRIIAINKDVITKPPVSFNFTNMEEINIMGTAMRHCINTEENVRKSVVLIIFLISNKTMIISRTIHIISFGRK